LNNHWKYFKGRINHGLKTGICEIFLFKEERIVVNFTRGIAEGKGTYYRSDGTEEKVTYSNNIATNLPFRPKSLLKS